MNVSPVSTVLIFLLFSVSSCIRQVEVPLRTVEKILVVDGGITTDTAVYRLRLSYSGPFRFGNFIPDSLIETNATVHLQDDAGHRTGMIHTTGGWYESADPDFIGRTGRSYSIEILLPGGKTYISDPEPMPAPVRSSEISRVDFDFFHYNLKNPSQFKVYANVKDPASEENYYLWKCSGFIPRKATGVPCGFGCVQGEFCQQITIDTTLRFLSDQSINGNMITNQLVGAVPVYWFGRYYLDLQQYSITRPAFQFLRQLTEQTSRTGTTLDPIPSSIVGNIYNASDPGDRALGFFSASSVYHHRVVLLPLSLTQFILDQTATRFIPAGECTLALPNTTEITDPPGFENAERIKFSW